MILGVMMPNPTGTGGPSVQSKALVKSLSTSAPNVDHVHIICQKGTIPDNRWFGGADVTFHDVLEQERYLASYRRFRAVLDRIDVLHVYYGDWVTNWACSFQRSVPVLIGPSTAITAKLNYPSVKLTSARYVFTTHRPLSNAYHSYGLSDEDIAYVPAAVDTDHFRPGDGDARERLATELDVDLDEHVLFWPNHVRAHKRPLLAIEAFRALRERRDDVTLLMAGDGPQADDVRDAIEPVPDAHYLGYIHHRELNNYYAAADLTLLTSKSEGCPNVLRESMACETPLVTATDFEKIGQEEHGVYLSSQSTPEEIADGVETFLSDAGALGAECRAYMLENYSMEARAQRFETLYRWVAGEVSEPAESLAWMRDNVYLFGGRNFITETTATDDPFRFHYERDWQLCEPITPRNA